MSETPDAGVGAGRLVAAIVLAAGRSTRMAGSHKLLAGFGDGTVLGHSLDAVLASGLNGGTVVVLGHEAARVAASLGRRAVATIVAADHATGLVASLRAGLAAVPDDRAGILVQLGDMPLIRPQTIDRLLGRFRDALARDAAAIVRPVFRGQAGHPVLWSRRHVASLAACVGDRGGQAILTGPAAPHLVLDEVEDEGVVIDVDTGPALEAARAVLARRGA